MKLHSMTLAAAVVLATAGSLCATGSGENSVAFDSMASTNDATLLQISEPHWPRIETAEREMGDGIDDFPESMFVEYSNNRWHAWVIMEPLEGPAKAMDFFSGKVQTIQIKNDRSGENISSFEDERGVLHERAIDPVFEFKDPRPGGAIGQLTFSEGFVRGIGDINSACSPQLEAVQRTLDDQKTIVWRKIPLYLKSSLSPACPKGVWNSGIGTAMNLRDGTMLFTAGKFIFRVQQADLKPVGTSTHLHVVDEAKLIAVAKKISGVSMENASAYLTKVLDLN